MKNDVQALLNGDTTLTDLLTGGVHARREIERTLTPGAFDGDGRLLPCALVKDSTDTPFGPHDTSTQTFIAIYFYQYDGTGVIDPAKDRVYALLHRACGIGDSLEMYHADDTLNQYDSALHADMHVSRYWTARIR